MVIFWRLLLITRTFKIGAKLVFKGNPAKNSQKVVWKRPNTEFTAFLGLGFDCSTQRSSPGPEKSMENHFIKEIWRKSQKKPKNSLGNCKKNNFLPCLGLNLKIPTQKRSPDFQHSSPKLEKLQKIQFFIDFNKFWTQNCIKMILMNFLGSNDEYSAQKRSLGTLCSSPEPEKSSQIDFLRFYSSFAAKFRFFSFQAAVLKQNHALGHPCALHYSKNRRKNKNSRKK